MSGDWHHDAQVNVEVTPTTAVDLRHAGASNPECVSGLAPRIH
jgi:hypothetical protein